MLGSEVIHQSEHLTNSEKVTEKLSENLTGQQELTGDRASSETRQHPELRIHWQKQHHQGVCGWAFSANASWDSEYKTATAVTTAAAAAMDAAALAAAAVTDAAAAHAVTLAGANSALAVILAGANSALAYCEQCLAAAVAQSWRQQQQAAVHAALAPSAADADVVLDSADPDVHLHLRAQLACVASEHHLMAYLRVRLHCLVLAAVTELHAEHHHQTGC